MSNITNKPDAATLALWRAAETGEFGEVETLLARVADLNAPNEHGVTALMRAAQNGHARVVRLLLLHGADANVVRNDKFTALSLAAFFGHTEVVRMLMEHGADSKASTRHGTSAHMWATARTFNEVVDQLKEPKPPRDEGRAEFVVERLAPAAPPKTSPSTTATVTPVVARPVTAAIVRTLKDPPEIWDLVHEEAKGFDASSAFMGHLQSMRRGLLFRLATVAVLICAGVVGVLVLRGAQARNEVTPERPVIDATATVKSQSENTGVEHRSVPASVTATAAATSSFVEPPVSPVTTESFRTATTQRRRSHSSAAGSREIILAPAEPSAKSEGVQRSQNQIETTNAPNEKSDVKVQTSDAKAQTQSGSKAKFSSPLSPQLITPAKSVSSKSKVIQWP